MSVRLLFGWGKRLVRNVLFFIGRTIERVFVPVTVTDITGNRIQRRDAWCTFIAIVAPESFQRRNTNHLMTLLVDTITQEVKIFGCMHPSADQSLNMFCHVCLHDKKLVHQYLNDTFGSTAVPTVRQRGSLPLTCDKMLQFLTQAVSILANKNVGALLDGLDMFGIGVDG